mgnify:FL=1
MQDRVKRAVDLATAAGEITDLPEDVLPRAGFGRRMRAALGAATVNRGARVGLVLVLALVFIAVFAPVIAPYEPDEMGAGMFLSPPSAD